MYELIEHENMSLDATTVLELSQMVKQSLSFYQETSPIYEKIARTVLDVFSNEKEIANLEHKDLFKLLELSQKAQLQPVETLIKLVQNLNTLYERSALAAKMDSLQQVVKDIQNKAQDQYTGQDSRRITIDEIKES
jgi:hypothetical protein